MSASVEKLRPEDRLIVALDVEGLPPAESLVQQMIALGITHFKIGFGLFTQAGPAAVEMVHRNGGQVFLDLKFHDIPSTVAHAARACTRLGVWMMNLHIQGGSPMMRQAAAAIKDESAKAHKKPPLLIGVTILTSMSEKDLLDLGMRKTLKDQVIYLAKRAIDSGLDGIVASAQEATAVRWASGEDFLIVTPGIRPASDATDFLSEAAGKAKDDQQRVTTASEAVKAGADYLVVGRPILAAPDPKAAAGAILRELKEK